MGSEDDTDSIARKWSWNVILPTSPTDWRLVYKSMAASYTRPICPEVCKVSFSDLSWLDQFAQRRVKCLLQTIIDLTNFPRGVESVFSWPFLIDQFAKRRKKVSVADTSWLDPYFIDKSVHRGCWLQYHARRLYLPKIFPGTLLSHVPSFIYIGCVSPHPHADLLPVVHVTWRWLPCLSTTFYLTYCHSFLPREQPTTSGQQLNLHNEGTGS